MIMGKTEDNVVHRGGAGAAKRKEAAEYAISVVQDVVAGRTPDGAIVQLKGHTDAEDGHSFCLVVKPDGATDVMEGWAVEAEPGQATDASVSQLLKQLRKNIAPDDVIAALRRIGDDDPDTRTEGYRALSSCGYASHNFEEAKADDKGRHARDPNARLDLYYQPLKKEAGIKAAMNKRIQLSKNWLAPKIEELKIEVVANREAALQQCRNAPKLPCVKFWLTKPGLMPWMTSAGATEAEVEAAYGLVNMNLAEIPDEFGRQPASIEYCYEHTIKNLAVGKQPAVQRNSPAAPVPSTPYFHAHQ